MISLVMIKALLFDFSYVLLFPKDTNYHEELNTLHRKLSLTQNYDFLANFQLNEELMIYITNLKEKYKIFMYTSGTIQNAPEIKDKVDALFEKIFSAEEMMLSKKESDSYKKIAELIGLPIEEILFVDDLEANILPAKYAGMGAYQYKDNKSLMDHIKSLE